MDSVPVRRVGAKDDNALIDPHTRYQRWRTSSQCGGGKLGNHVKELAYRTLVQGPKE